MKTRKNRKRKGGLLGLRVLKTRGENRENCRRLANNFQKRDDFLHRKYKCATSNVHKGLCDAFHNTQVEMHRECANPKMIDDYDFSRDGLHVKQRTKSFFGSDKVPSEVDGEPWNKLTYHFKKRPNDLKEYDLKTEDEIVKEN